MRTFEYSRAATVDELVALLNDGDGSDGAVRPLAGGTDLLTLIKADLVAPSRLVDLKRAEGLTAGLVETADGALELGALTTLAEIEHSALLRERYPALAEAAALAATPQLRNMATLGGNLLQRPRCWYFRNPRFHCWLKGGDECQARDGENQQHAIFDASPCVAAHPSDLAAALLALNAEVRILGSSGERVIPSDGFFALPTAERRTETTLDPGEVILSLRLPAAAGGRSTYLKAMDRKVWSFALASVAAALRLDGGRIAAARLVLGGVAPIPWRAVAAEQALVGHPPSEELFARVADTALADARPLQHNGYKLPLARALIRRALASLTASTASVDGST